MDHGDSLGNKGSILAGGVQWMSCRLWDYSPKMPQASQNMLVVSAVGQLPRKDKMSEPSYGDIVASDVPKVEEPNAVVRVSLLETTRVPRRFRS